MHYKMQHEKFYNLHVTVFSYAYTSYFQNVQNLERPDFDRLQTEGTDFHLGENKHNKMHWETMCILVRLRKIDKDNFWQNWNLLFLPSVKNNNQNANVKKQLKTFHSWWGIDVIFNAVRSISILVVVHEFSFFLLLFSLLDVRSSMSNFVSRGSR